MPQLKDMKLTPADQAEWRQDIVEGPEPPEYPFGLTLRLDKDALDKLGISMPAMGETMEVSAIAKVVETRNEQSERFGDEKSVELQITELGVAPAQVNATDRLYPGTSGGMTGS